MRKTKIIATLGPSTNSVEKIKELINAGLNGARINFSHGTHESHSKIINMLKQAREELGANVALVLDTKGPEIRTKSLLNGETVELEQGKTFTITIDDVVGTKEKVAVTYLDFNKDLKVGECILIDDGLIELKVKQISGNDVICDIINSGVLGENKGINLPGVSVNLPALTEKDIADIVFGIEMGFDVIAASFIRSAKDVKSIRKVLKENNAEYMTIISKIENREGIDNADEIIEESDGVMIARGDMGVEIPTEEVPIVQKMLIKKCRRAGKVVVTATQMLESMITNPRPTRAEASDVANAIYDGTDAIMLSGETAKGMYPVQALQTMARIAEKIESSIDYTKILLKSSNKINNSITNAISHASCVAATQLNASCIVAITKTGHTARNISKMRPETPIIAITEDEVIRRQLQLVWGCIPVLDKDLNISKNVEKATSIAEKTGVSRKGDIIAVVAGFPGSKEPSTNMLEIHRI